MKIVVLDGQGGRLGQRLVERILEECPDADLLAVGLNDSATRSLIKAGAQQVSTGENAAVVACRRAQIIMAPLGMAISDSLLGEVSPAIAVAVGSSEAHRILIPMNMCDNYVAGVSASSSEIIDDAMRQLHKLIEGA